MGREIAYWQALVEALRLEMQRDPSVILLGEDIAGAPGRAEQGFIDAWGGPFGTTRGLIKEFGPERVLDTPISETAFIGCAVGAAMSGLRPWVELMFPEFLGVALDQVMNNAARQHYYYGGKTRVPLTIKTWMNRWGLLYSMLVHIPGLKCVAPSDPYTAKGLMISAIRDDDPVVVFDHLDLLRTRAEVPEHAYAIPIGKSIVKKAGKDITIIGISKMTNACIAAATALAEDGVDVEVIDLLSMSPLDEETIRASVRKTGRLLIVDEDYERCSLARDIAALVTEKEFNILKSAPTSLTSPHSLRPFSAPLSEAFPPTTATIIDAAKGQFVAA